MNSAKIIERISPPSPSVTLQQQPSPSPLATFFDSGLKAVFSHVSQLASSSLIVSAGIYVTRHTQSLDIVGLVDVYVAGTVLTVIGVLLLLLNFFQGLYLLARLRHPWLLQGLMIVIYIFISIRAAQLVVAVRNAS